VSHESSLPPSPMPPAGSARNALLIAIGLTIPALVLRAVGFHPESSAAVGLLVYGMGIVSAAFLLTWGAEVAQLDIGSGLAVVFLALVTVLPEYAVDMLLAWTSATIPERQSLALANMTGANQLLIGVGWPTLALIVWRKRRGKEIVLGKDKSGDVVWLLIATLYSLHLPLKGFLAWYDALVLFAIYGFYVAGSKNEPEAHGELVGPPRAMARWPKRRRRVATTLLFLWSAFAILAAAHPFVESFEVAGTHLGIHPRLMIGWIAPLASESPEFVVVILLTLRGAATMGFGALVSSKVNQWTLLVGGIPIAFGLAHLVKGAGFAGSFPIDAHQVEMLFLTASQGLYAVATILDLRFSLAQALAILGLFLAQFVGSLVLELGMGRHDLLGRFHNLFSVVYVVLALERFWSQRAEIPLRFREAFRRGRLIPPEPPEGVPRPRDVEPAQRPSDVTPGDSTTTPSDAKRKKAKRKKG
jgi:cation:H+ antiporter